MNKGWPLCFQRCCKVSATNRADVAAGSCEPVARGRRMSSIELILGLGAVVVLDQMAKVLAARVLRSRSISLGWLGEMRLDTRQVWIAQQGNGIGLPALWSCWLFGAIVVMLVSALVPGNTWYAALLLGGSASHALETSRHGAVRDYVWLRFWPGFNLADVAITIGALGLVWTLASRFI